MTAHPHPTEPAAGPSYSGTVVLELGPGAGALVLRAPAELDGAEIDVSSDTGNGIFRTHSMVRPRYVANGTIYAAVYPELPPGSYTVWTTDGEPGPAVTITGGSVTTASLAG
jgi:hypothetical protein